MESIVKSHYKDTKIKASKRKREQTPKNEFEETLYEEFKPFLMSTPTKRRRVEEILSPLSPQVDSTPVENESLWENREMYSEETIYDDFIPHFTSTPEKNMPIDMRIKKPKCTCRCHAPKQSICNPSYAPAYYGPSSYYPIYGIQISAPLYHAPISYLPPVYTLAFNGPTFYLPPHNIQYTYRRWP